MIDFGVRAQTEADLFVALEAMGAFTFDATGFELRFTGPIDGGGSWWVDVIGPFTEPGATEDDPPTVRDGQHVNMRWNGSTEHMPSLPPELELIWRSDDETLARPDWWSRVMA